MLLLLQRLCGHTRAAGGRAPAAGAGNGPVGGGQGGPDGATSLETGVVGPDPAAMGGAADIGDGLAVDWRVGTPDVPELPEAGEMSNGNSAAAGMLHPNFDRNILSANWPDTRSRPGGLQQSSAAAYGGQAWAAARRDSRCDY